MSKKYGAFRWCWPKFNVYRPAANVDPPRIALNCYNSPEPTIIGIEVGLFGRRWGIQWKRS